MDSWEDEIPSTSQPSSNHVPAGAHTSGPTLNVNAPSFSFNPSASSFNPYGQTAFKSQPAPAGQEAAELMEDPPAESDPPVAAAPSRAAQEDVAMSEPPDRGERAAQIQI